MHFMLRCHTKRILKRISRAVLHFYCHLFIRGELLHLAEAAQFLHDEGLQLLVVAEDREGAARNRDIVDKYSQVDISTDLGRPRLSAQNLTEGSSGTMTATVTDLRELPCTHTWRMYWLSM